MNKVPLYHGATGLNDFLDKMRVPYNSESGILGLSEADDITFDISGAIRRRDGFSLLFSSKTHSIFPCGDYGLCVSNGYLSVINPDLTITNKANVGNFKMAYARYFDGQDDLVYFSNGVVTGVVRNKEHGAWTVPAYAGPASTRAAVMELMSSIPAGQILGIHNGRMYVAQGNVLYPSEQYGFSWFDPSKAKVFDSRITMMRFVLGGAYVSTNSEILFLPGSDIEDFGKFRVYSFRAIEGTDVLIPGIDAAIQSQGDIFFFAASGRGICSADSSGVIVNHTENTVVFPEGFIGSAYINSRKEYVVTILR